MLQDDHDVGLDDGGHLVMMVDRVIMMMARVMVDKMVLMVSRMTMMVGC